MFQVPQFKLSASSYFWIGRQITVQGRTRTAEGAKLLYFEISKFK